MSTPNYSHNPGEESRRQEQGRFNGPDYEGPPQEGEEGPESAGTLESLIGAGNDLALRDVQEDVFRDPFQVLKQASEVFELKMGRGGSILDQMGDRLAFSTEKLQSDYRTGRGRTLSIENNLETGFINQPRASFYQERFSQPGAKVSGSIYQLQQREVVASLLQGRASGRIYTQAYEPSAPGDSGNKGANIVGPNELSIRASQRQAAADRLTFGPAEARVEIRGVRAMGSFHAKVGFVELATGQEYGFIGAQNVTTAIERSASFNPVLSVKSNVDLTTGAGRFESGLVQQIKTVTQAIDDVMQATGDDFYVPGSIRARIGQLGGAANIAVEGQILTRLNSAMEMAATKSNLSVVISSAEVGLLLSSSSTSAEVIALRQRALVLAGEGRLELITGQKTIDRVMAQGGTGGDTLGMRMLDTLLVQGNLRLANTGYLHDKTVAVIDRSKGELRLISTGSANITGLALDTVAEGLRQRNAYVQRGVRAASKERPMPASAMQETFNFEANVFIGDQGTDEEQEFLRTMEKQFFTTYGTLGGQSLIGTRRTLSRTGYISEARAGSAQVQDLARQLQSLSKKEGFDGLITVKNRYNLSAGLNKDNRLQGLEVSIQSKGGVGLHSATFFLTVQENGTVVFSNKNKVLTGSTFVNKTGATRTIAGMQVASGQSVSLTGIQTAVGLVSTMAYALEAQSTLGLPNEFFREQLDTGLAQEGSKKLLSTLLDLAGGATPGAQGGFNSTNTLEAMARTFETRPDLLRDIRGVIGERAGDMHSMQFMPHSQMAGFTSEQLVKRAQALASVFDVFTSPEGLPANERVRRTVYELNRVLNNDYDNSLADMRAALIMSDPVLRSLAQKRASEETKTIEAMLLSPLQEPSSLQYSAQQARHRRPIYGITDQTKDIPDGFDVLNPITVRPGVRVGKPGEYIQLIGASGYVQSTYGQARLSNMRMTKEELGTGAVTLYSTKGVFNSTPNLAYVTPEQRLEQIAKTKEIYRNFLINRNVTEEDARDRADELIFEIHTEDTIYVPFAASKLEQVQQRLKNTLGARSAIVGDTSVYERLIGLDPSLDSDTVRRTINAGSIRTTLPATQFERVRAMAANMDGDYERVEAALRQEELNPLNTDRGYLTTKGLKTVAVNIGLNFMGDFGIANPKYKETNVEAGVMSIRFSTKGISDVQGFMEFLSNKMSRGARIFGRPVAIGSQALEDAGIITRGDDGRINAKASIATLRERQAEDASYNKFMIQTDRSGNVRVMLREGLYVASEGTSGEVTGYERIAGISSDGLITFGQASRYGTSGEFVDPLGKKSAAFTKRYQDGVTVLTGMPSIDANLQRGTVTIQSESITATTPQSGMRSTGAALDKGALIFGSDAFFDYLENGDRNLSEDQRVKLNGVYKGGDPSNNAVGGVDQSQRMNRLYGLFSFNTIKGYNIGTGIHYITNSQHRTVLESATAMDKAKSAAMLFMGKSMDDPVKQALVGHYRGMGTTASAIQAERIIMSSTADHSNTALAQHASGLNLLASPGHRDGDNKLSIKYTIAAALRGDQAALDHIDAAYSHLFDLVGNTERNDLPVSKFFMDNNGVRTVTVNDSDPTVRSAAILADSLFTMQAITGAQAMGGIGTMRFTGQGGRSLNHYAQKYRDDESFRTKVDAIGLLAGKQKLPELTDGNWGRNKKAVKRRLSELQAMMDAQIVIERVIDYQMSTSLSPYGSKDSVGMEYHLTAGTSTGWLNRLKPFMGGTEEAAQIQQAYGALMNLAMPGSVKASGMMTKYVLPLPHDNLDIATRGIREFESAEMSRHDIENRERMHRMSHLGMFSSDMQMENIHLAIRGQGNYSDAQRAANLSMASGGAFKYISSTDGQQAQAIQMGITLGVGDNLLDRVSGMYADALMGYGRNLATVETGSKYGALMSFQDYLDANRADGAGNLERQYKYFQDVNQSEHLPMTKAELRVAAASPSGREQVLQATRQHLTQMNERSMEKLQAEMNMTEGQRYLQGIIDLRQSAQISESGELGLKSRAVLAEMEKSRQIILPAFQATKDGSGFKVNFIMDAAQAAPTNGVLLGSDVLTFGAVSFPGFDSQLLTNQMRTERLLAQSHDILRKSIMGETVSQEELTVLSQLQSAIESTKDAPLQLLESELARKAYGDRLEFNGASAGAVDSLALGFNEVVVGSRARVLHDSNPVQEVLKNQINRIDDYMNSRSRGEGGQGEERSPLVESDRLIEQMQILVGARDDGTRAGVRSSVESYMDGISQLAVNAPSGDLVESMQENADAAATRRESKGRLKMNLKMQLYAIAIGIPESKVRGMSSQQLRDEINLTEGVTNRGGSPTGSSLMTQEYNLSSVRTVETSNQRVVDDNMRLTLDIQRSQMLVMMPTLSWMLPQGGDFDGDFYTFVAGTRGLALKNLKEIDSQIGRRKARVAQLERAMAPEVGASAATQRDPAVKRTLPGGMWETREAEIVQANQEIAELETQRETFFNEFDSQYGAEKKDSRDLSQLKKWAGSYMLQPEWMEAYSSTAENLGSVEQMRVLFSGVNDNADLIARSDRKAADLASIVNKLGVLPQEGEISNAADQLFNNDETVRTKYGTVADLAHDIKLAVALQEQDGFQYNRDSVAVATTQLSGALYRNVTTYSAGMDGINKQFGKVAGIISTMSEFDNVQGTMQQAGALLGVAYNSLVPMVDQVIFQNSFGMVAAQGGDSFRRKLIDRLTEQQGGEDVIIKMGLRRAESFNAYLQQNQATVSNTVTFISGMQQAVRDAIKQKGEGGVAGTLKKFEMSQKLAAIDTENVSEAEKDRARASLLREFMSEQYKSIDLEVGQGNQFTDLVAPQRFDADGRMVALESGKGFDWGVTGFGAMFALSEYQQASSDEDLQKLIEGNDRWREAYTAAVESGQRIDADRFVAEQLSEVITRTQASFIASRTAGSGSAEESYIERARQYHTAVLDQRVQDDSRSYRVVERFFREEEALKSRQATTAEEIKRKNTEMGDLRSNFVHALTYVEASDRNVMSAERMQGLRQQRAVSMAVTKEDALNQDAFMDMEETIGRSQMQLNQEFRRGKMFGAQEMTGVVSSELQAIYDYSQANGVTVEQAADMMFMMGANFIPDDSRMSEVLTRAMVQGDSNPDAAPGDRSILGDFSAQTAATTQLLAIQAEKARLAKMLLATDENGEHAISGANKDLAIQTYEGLDREYSEVYSLAMGSNQTPLNAGYNTGTSSDMAQELENFRNEAQKQAGAQQAMQSQRAKKNKFVGDPRLEMFGALLAPALFAMGGGGIGTGFEERLGQMGFDAFQSLPEIAQMGAGNKKVASLFGELTNLNEVAEKAAGNFRRARITDQIRENGLMGIGTGIAQEMLFSATSIASQKVVGAAFGGIEDGHMTGGNAIARIGSELLGAALAQGISRRITERFKPGGPKTESYSAVTALGDMLSKGLESIQVNTQKAIEGLYQKAMGVEDVSMEDGDTAQPVDFVAALPSELERDIETGMVVIDENGDELDVEGEETRAQGIGSYKKKPQTA